MGLQPGVSFSAHVSSVGWSSSALQTGLSSGRSVPAGAGARAGGKSEQCRRPEWPALGAPLRPRLLAAPRPAFPHVGRRVRVPFLPSGGVTVASVVNHEYRIRIRDWGPPWCSPLSQAARADTVKGKRQAWTRVGFIWGRTVGWCCLGEQGPPREAAPGRWRQSES